MQWYEELFQNYAESYDKEVFTQGTAGEVDFIEKELNFDKKVKILDIGCGTGRHSIELAKRGYSVTGLDLSRAQIDKAKEKAKAAGVEIDFLQKDARDFNFEEKFGAALLICEGAFSLMESDEMNFQILKNAYDSLAGGGKIVLTCLNGFFAATQPLGEFLGTDDYEFSPLTMRASYDFKFKDDSGAEKTLKASERFFFPTEIKWFLKTLGFSKISISGCKLGAFSKEDKLGYDDIEILAVAEK